MTLYLGTFLDTPDDPFAGGLLRVLDRGAVLVHDGVVVARGTAGDLRGAHPDEEVVDLTGGLVLPGFVDTHVHFPQVRMIGALGMPLLEWLERSALPEEARLADTAYADAVATEFLSGITAAGTTSALVFGAHFAPAVDVLFSRAAEVGLRMTSGLVVSDRILRPELLTAPETAYDEGLTLAKRWHGVGRNRYAVIPRFSLSCSDALLESSAALLDAVEGAWFTSHVNENGAEIAEVARLFDGSSYVDTYDRHGLLNARSVLAHNVHPTDTELATLAGRGAAVSHCPTSNSALGSGLFPMRRHVEAGVRVAMGSDVGAGTGFCLLKEGLQAYFMQRLLGTDGLPLTSAHLLWLCTAAGADALGLAHDVGDLSVGKQFDAIWLLPESGDPLAVGLGNAKSAEDALSKVFALGTTSDIGGVWVGGDQIAAGRWRRPPLT